MDQYNQTDAWVHLLHGAYSEDPVTGEFRQAGHSLLAAAHSSAVFRHMTSLPAMISDRQDTPLNLMFSGKWQPHDRATTLKTLPDDDSASIRHWFDSTAARDHGAGRAEQFDQERATRITRL